MESYDIEIDKIVIKSRREYQTDDDPRLGLTTIIYNKILDNDKFSLDDSNDDKIPIEKYQNEKRIWHLLSGIEKNDKILIASCEKEVIAYQISPENEIEWNSEILKYLHEKSHKKIIRMLFYIGLLIPVLSLSLLFSKISQNYYDPFLKIFKKDPFWSTPIKVYSLMMMLSSFGILLFSPFFYQNYNIKIIYILLFIHFLGSILYIYIHNDTANKMYKKYRKIKLKIIQDFQKKT